MRKRSRKGGKVDVSTDEDGAASSQPDSTLPASAIINSRRLLRDPSYDVTPPTPPAETDKLLESLHTSLRQQLTISPNLLPTVSTAPVSTPVSGAVARSLGRTHDKTPAAKRKVGSGGSRPRQVPADIERLLIRAQEILAASKVVNVDQFKAREDLKWGELALDAKEYKVAAACFKKVERRAKETLDSSLPLLIKRARSALKNLQKHDGTVGNAGENLKIARESLEMGHYADAIQALSNATKKIRDGEQEVVLKIMFNAKERFMLARKVGINIDRPLDLLRISRERLRAGEFEEAIQCAEEGQRQVDLLIKREHRGKQHLGECVKAIKVAELLGAGSKELDDSLKETMALFKTDELDKALEASRNLTARAKKAAYDRAASTYEMAERTLGVARSLGLDIQDAEETLDHARKYLDHDDTVRSFTLSTSAIVDTNAVIMESLNDKLKNIGQFAKGIEGEVMSLTEVQEAIEHTKERSLENFRKYAKLSEDLVHQAFESAMSYTRVSHDVVKGVFNSSVAINGGKAVAEGEITGKQEVSAEIVATAGTSPEEKRLRIINLYLDGKITESQLERLLTLIDSSVAKVNLV